MVALDRAKNGFGRPNRSGDCLQSTLQGPKPDGSLAGDQGASD